MFHTKSLVFDSCLRFSRWTLDIGRSPQKKTAPFGDGSFPRYHPDSPTLWRGRSAGRASGPCPLTRGKRPDLMPVSAGKLGREMSLQACEWASSRRLTLSDQTWRQEPASVNAFIKIFYPALAGRTFKIGEISPRYFSRSQGRASWPWSPPAILASSANAASSWTAISERTFRSRVTPALLRPDMNWP